MKDKMIDGAVTLITEGFERNYHIKLTEEEAREILERCGSCTAINMPKHLLESVIDQMIINTMGQTTICEPPPIEYKPFGKYTEVIITDEV